MYAPYTSIYLTTTAPEPRSCNANNPSCSLSCHRISSCCPVPIQPVWSSVLPFHHHPFVGIIMRLSVWQREPILMQQTNLLSVPSSVLLLPNQPHDTLLNDLRIMAKPRPTQIQCEHILDTSRGRTESELALEKRGLGLLRDDRITPWI
jgi:hypothetical protein